MRVLEVVMKIRLRNIGIIKDSTIELNGLTVITGRNCSGKTTVGKALYSLVEATSDLNSRANEDKSHYIFRRLDDIYVALDIFRFLFNDTENSLGDTYIEFGKLFTKYVGWRYTSELGSEAYIRALLDELNSINVDNFVNQGIITPRYAKRISGSTDFSVVLVTLKERISKAKEIIINIFEKISSDPLLTTYARDSIQATLQTEFNGQIIPAAHPDEEAHIDMTDDGTVYYKIKLVKNTIVNVKEPVFISSPFKNVFFVDSSYILDRNVAFARFNNVNYDIESWLDVRKIVPHSTELANTLFDENVIPAYDDVDKKDGFSQIKEHIDDIVPGIFKFDDNRKFVYIHKGKPLQYSNLATGSKTFSIFKLLLDKKLIVKESLLILDEPESHLHPEWQNVLAEVIVLLVSKLGTNILLTTHSSQFMLAIDAFMRKYKINDERCNFYQTKHIDDMVEYECVNNDLGKIYADHVEYLSDMKLLRDSFFYDDYSEN